MSTMARSIHAEPIPMKPELITPAPPRKTKNPRVKWIKWMSAIGLAVLIAAGTLLWRANVQNAVTYQTVQVERGSIQARVTATGTLNAVVDVLISSQVSGNIKALYADWNSKVKKGQLVALIRFRVLSRPTSSVPRSDRGPEVGIALSQSGVSAYRVV